MSDLVIKRTEETPSLRQVLTAASLLTLEDKIHLFTELSRELHAILKLSSEQPSNASLLGLWKGLDVHITEDDIQEVRREMWSGMEDEDN